MNETFELIQKLATERSKLYRLAGSSHLTNAQVSRIHEIEGHLVRLWDVHRREVAASNRPIRYNDAIRAA